MKRKIAIANKLVKHVVCRKLDRLALKLLLVTYLITIVKWQIIG